MKLIEAIHKGCLNHEWPTASNCAPKVCEDCMRKLEKPSYKMEVIIKPCKSFPSGLVSSHSGEWRVDCKCGVCYRWMAFYGLPENIAGKMGQFYVKTHRTVELLMAEYPNGNLCRPMNVQL